MDVRRYHYVGPDAIRERPRGEPGVAIGSSAELMAWLVRCPEAMTEGATYVVDERGALRVAPRRSEHIDCAGGESVLAAGEIRFSRGGAVVEVSNQSTGYCPDPDCWQAVAAALRSAGIAGPVDFTRRFVFRRCPDCGQINLIKDEWYVCAACDADLPRAWNFAPMA